MYGTSFSMNLRSLPNETLLGNIKNLAQKERDVTLEVLHHLREVERRSLFAELSYSSLWEYAVQELHYSEGSAHRRIASMRMLKELPEIEEKLESGKLSLSAVAQAQTFFKNEKTQTSEKLEILKSLENKSTREVEKELLSRSAEPLNLIPEKLRQVTATHAEIKILVDDVFLKEMESLKALLSHQIPSASIKDLLSFALKNAVKTLTPKEPKEKAVPKKAATKKDPEKLAPPAQNEAVRRHLPAQVKRVVWHRDRGQCTYSHDGKRCTSKHSLENDHIKPFALGGESTMENLRLRCKSHNQLAALQVFGATKMAKFIPRMR